MKKRDPGFLRPELIDHDSEQFDYIKELHQYLWSFVRCEFPDACGHLSGYVDIALKKAQKRTQDKELAK